MIPASFKSTVLPINLCRHGNAAIVVLAALFFCLIPGVTGIPRSAWKVHRTLSPKIERWASQLSWILRPFISSPTLPVELVCQAAFHGNFFEAVLNSAPPNYLFPMQPLIPLNYE